MNPRLQIVLAALLFSTGGAAIKWVGAGAWQVAGFRAGIAGLTLLALIPAARRGWSWRTVLVGLTYGATTLLYVQANRNTTAASTIFLQNTNPVFILVLAPWALGERATFARHAVGWDARLLLLANRLLPAWMLRGVIRLAMGLPRHAAAMKETHDAVVR